MHLSQDDLFVLAYFRSLPDLARARVMAALPHVADMALAATAPVNDGAVKPSKRRARARVISFAAARSTLRADSV